MKQTRYILSLLAAPALLCAADAIVATPALVMSGAPLPPDVPFEAKPFSHETGLSVTWLVRAENIVDLKQDSMKLTTFTLAGSTGKPSSWKNESHKTHVSKDGLWASFNLLAPGIAFDRTGQVQIVGTVTMILANGTETVDAPALALDAKAPVKAGAYTIAIASGKAFGSDDNLTLQLTGNIQALKDVSVKADGKTLSNSGSMSSDNNKNMYFAKPTSGPLLVQLTLYKDLREVPVQFSYAPGAKK